MQTKLTPNNLFNNIGTAQTPVHLTIHAILIDGDIKSWSANWAASEHESETYNH